MFWAIGTPAIYENQVMFGFTRLARYILQDGEGWFYRCDNILSERDPDKLDWQLLPEGDHGVRAPEFGSVQEEFDVVHLEKDDWFCVNRTTLGHAAAPTAATAAITGPSRRRCVTRPAAAPSTAACLRQDLADAQWPLLALVHNNGTTTTTTA